MSTHFLVGLFLLFVRSSDVCTRVTQDLSSDLVRTCVFDYTHFSSHWFDIGPVWVTREEEPLASRVTSHSPPGRRDPAGADHSLLEHACM